MLGTIFYAKEPTREFPGGDMPSHTLPKYLSMIRYNSKITPKTSKITPDITSKTIHSGKVQTEAKINNKCYKQYDTIMTSLSLRVLKIRTKNIQMIQIHLNGTINSHF